MNAAFPGAGEMGMAGLDPVRQSWGLRIPLRDGVHLSAILYLPADSLSPAPAICTLTPYMAQTYHDVGLAFARAGYPFIAVDVRGRGNSEGEFHPGLNEARDGFDAVAWIGAQSWCDGRVALWGGSYSGHLQWAVAGERPPALAAIAPAASLYWGHDFPARNGIAGPYLMQWLAFTWGRALQDDIFWDRRHWAQRFYDHYRSGLSFAALDRFLGIESATFQDWIVRPASGSEWDCYNPTQADYDSIELPVLTVTGIYDGDQPGALRHYRQHLLGDATRRSRHQLVIGPWDHAGTRTPKAEFCGLKVGPASLVDLVDLHRRWYDWVLRNGPRPDFLADDVLYYMMGADDWRCAPALEAITTDVRPFFLAAEANPTDVFRSGTLECAPTCDGVDEFVHDPRCEDLAALERDVDVTSKTDQRLLLASTGRHLVYHSAPFSEATELAGFFRFEAWLSIDQPDVDFRVSVHEVALDGGALQLSFDTMRARHRGGLARERLIDSDAPKPYEFSNFFWTARLIPRGHRLRLVLACINSIHSQRNMSSGKRVIDETPKDGRPVRVRLHRDRTRPAILHMPVAGLAQPAGVAGGRERD